MRVIAGKFRSRRLKGPGPLPLRPTSDRLRETLFNILGPTVEESLFVDLYAGTGAVGIEAISRGAREVFFIERNVACLKLLRQNRTEVAWSVLPVNFRWMLWLGGIFQFVSFLALTVGWSLLGTIAVTCSVTRLFGTDRPRVVSPA